MRYSDSGLGWAARLLDLFVRWLSLQRAIVRLDAGVGDHRLSQHVDERRGLAFAGLWEHWEASDGETIDSCTIITTEPNDLLAPLHSRMPVIIHPKDQGLWLDPHARGTSTLERLLRPYPADEMSAHPVSTRVNNPSADGPECTTPVPWV